MHSPELLGRFADLNPPTVYLSHENAARLPVHGSSLAFRAVGRPEGPDPDVRHRDISAGATGVVDVCVLPAQAGPLLGCQHGGGQTGMITAAIDVAVRGQAIEAVCHCSGWRRRGQDVPAVVGLPSWFSWLVRRWDGCRVVTNPANQPGDQERRSGGRRRDEYECPPRRAAAHDDHCGRAGGC